jgi:hypothetical protein
MAAKIKTALAAVGDPSGYVSPAAYADACREALCLGIIQEIQTNAAVAVPSVSGVTPGGGISGPGTGTIS